MPIVTPIVLPKTNDLSVLLQKALEASNSNELLAEVLKWYFDINCSVLSISKGHLYGSHFIANRYQSLTDTLSNISLQFSTTEKHHRLMVIEECCSGQIAQDCFYVESKMKAFVDAMEMINFQSEIEKNTFQMKLDFILSMSQKIPVTFNLKVDLHLVMNEDQSYIAHVMWLFVSLDVVIANY